MPANSPAAPRTAGGFVRPRLFDALERGTKGPVTLVSGPAGSGKTTLVGAWLREGTWTAPAAWVSVESAWRDDTPFWTAVDEALRSCSAPASLPEAPVTRHELVDRLANSLRQRAGPVLLVIDNLHHLEARAAPDNVRALLALAPAELRLLLVTRSDRWLGLHRLRVAGDLTELRGEDLAFTVQEADELLTAAGIQLSKESLARLHDRTEGWAAGLRLAAMWLAGRTDPDRFAERFSGSERTVAEYLTGEVLAGQPPAVRRMLRRTSVLERVNGPLANLLTGRSDGDRVLQDLEAANAFITSIDPDRSWFRYHPLLTDLLRMELRRDAPEEIETLHRAAARWHAAHGTPLEAIRHAQSGRAWRLATGLHVENWLGLLLDGRQREIGDLLAAIPAHATAANPELSAVAAADRLAAGSLDLADAHLALAERLADSVSESRRPRFDVTLAVAKLERARTRGDTQTMIEIARALLTPARGDPRVDADLRAFALMSIGLAEFWALELDDAERDLQESFELARRIGRPYIAIACLGYLAHIANLRQEADVSEDRSREAIELADRLGWSQHPVVGDAYLALGGGVLSRGRLEQADLWLDRATRALSGVRDPEASVSLPFTRGILRFAQRRYDEAVTSLRDAERAPATHFLSASARTWRLRVCIRLGDAAPAREALVEVGEAARRIAEWCNLAAYVHLADDDPASAVEAVRPVLDGSASSFHVNLEIEALLLAAVGHDQLGQTPAAERAVERALALAEPKEHVWIVLTVAGVPSLLERHPRHRTAHGAFRSELLDRLAGVTALRPSDQPAAVTEALSTRELDVLGFLPTNLSAAEIANELVLSIHTVKSHMRSLYAKLGVHRRADAVARARSLGVLAPTRRGR
jgi:LuxR family maltose regulon positive regulatory protein